MAEIAGRNSQESRIDQNPQGREFVPNPRERNILAGIIKIGARIALRIAAVISMATGGITACKSNSDNPNQPAGIPGAYGTQTGALEPTPPPLVTLDQILKIGEGQPVPWGALVASVPNYAEIDDEKYLFFASVEDEGGVAYVKGPTVKDCLSANANVQTVQGLIAAGMPYMTVQEGWSGLTFDYVYAGSSGAFRDKEGKEKLLVESDKEAVYKCDIATNDNGILEASNCAELDPPMSGEISIFTQIFKPYDLPCALWLKGAFPRLRWLNPGIEETLPFSGSWVNDCGPGFEIDDIDSEGFSATKVVVGSKEMKENWWEDIRCHLVAAKDWAELDANPIPLDVLNADSDLVQSPRLADDYILYSRNYKPWYAQIPDAPQPPEPETGDAGGADAGEAQPDAINWPDTDTADQPDAIDFPDTADQSPEADVKQEIAQDVANAADTKLSPEDTALVTDPELPPPLDTSPETDTKPDVKSDINQTTDNQPEIQTEQEPESQPDIGQPNPKPGNDTNQTQIETSADIITPAPEVSPEIANSSPTNPPKGCGGCSTTGKNPNSAGPLVAFGMTLMALGATARRRKQPTLKPASILTGTWNRVASGLGLRR